jgi:acyl-CoA reductase-like NAD-dependent aldehyde dehydrogenase
MSTTNWLMKAKDADLRIRNFMDGRYSEDKLAGDLINKYSSRDGKLLYQFGSGEVADVDRAVANAKTALDVGCWSRLPVSQRKKVLFKLADLLETHKEELALYECLDVGKPINSALNGDIPGAADAIRSAAEGADKLFSEAYSDGAGPNLAYQVRKPVGVVGAIVGWNFPLNLAATKLGPALAMGNSVVLKPSEFSSLSASRLAALAIEAGVPPGVLNVVHGAGATVGVALAQHKDVDLLTFTGSSATGKQVMIAAGQSNMKRVMLECGGKSPYIVFDDCPEDLDVVAANVVGTAFQNQGEVCSAGTRLLIQDSIKDQLMPKIIEQAKAMVAGDPLDSSSTYGAMINEAHMEKVLGYIESGVAEGANLVLGGKRVREESGGFYIEPTIFDEVDPKQKIAQEEIFGPVLSVLTFQDEDEAIRLANDSCFGLAAYVATTNLARSQRLGQRLSAGSIVVLSTSTPQSGGVAPGFESHKESGFGVESKLSGLASYTLTSTMFVMA